MPILVRDYLTMQHLDDRSGVIRKLSCTRSACPIFMQKYILTAANVIASPIQRS
jgi:hypothetical protein